jgi:YegS/Rv2252/BmrU family lipid kinase
MNPPPTIVLNPTARSETAQRRQREVRDLPGGSSIRITQGPGDATRLTREAVVEGSRVIVAAGGDGTINEVINGLVGTDAALGILPMGTVNVLARELRIPITIRGAWKIIEAGRSQTIDLIRADYQWEGQGQTRYFVQLAGAGLDAQIVREVSWEQKRFWGALSYAFEAVRSMVAMDEPPRLTVRIDGEETIESSLALIGNGTYYGGPIPVFRKASLTDGRMDICLFKSGGCLDLLRFLQAVVCGTHISTRGVTYQHGRVVEITAPVPVPVQLDGEFVGYTSLRMEIQPRALKIIVP